MEPLMTAEEWIKKHFRDIKLYKQRRHTTLYHAHDIALNDYVVIKRIKTDKKTVFFQLRTRIENNLKLSHHVHILPILRFFTDEKKLAVLFAIPLGTSLKKELSNGVQFRPMEAVSFLIDMADVLTYAKMEFKICHNAIKPSNLIKIDGRYKLGDWKGFSIIDDTETKGKAPEMKVDESDVSVGIPAVSEDTIYSAPEKLSSDFKKRLQLDPYAADIYSLALVTMRMLGLSEEIIDSLKTTPDSFYQGTLQRFFNDMPPSEFDFVNKALESMLDYDPKKRPSSEAICKTVSGSIVIPDKGMDLKFGPEKEEMFKAKQPQQTKKGKEILLLATGSGDETIKILDARKRTVISAYERIHGGAIKAVCFAPNGSHLASGSADECIRVTDVTSSEVMSNYINVHTGTIRSMQWSRDGKDLASAAYDGSIKVIDVHKEAIKISFEKVHQCAIWSISLHPGGKLLASAGSDKSVKIFDISSSYKKPLIEFKDYHQDWVKSVAFHPTLDVLASGSLDKTINLLDLKTMKLEFTFSGFQKDGINAIGFSPDGARIASGSNDRSLCLLDFNKRSILHNFEGGVECLAYSPDGQILVTGSRDNSIKIFDFVKRKIVYKCTEIHKGPVYSVSLANCFWSEIDKTA